MSEKITKMSDLMAVTQDSNSDEILGMFVYFSLSNVLIARTDLQEICKAVGLAYDGGKQSSSVNAFRSATGDIYKRIVLGSEIYKVYCRDNENNDEIISRELVKETLDATTNRYTKLANLSYSKETDFFSFDNLKYDPVINPYEFCEQAENLFEKYKNCAGRKHIETLVNAFLKRMQAIKVSSRGLNFFVPKKYMHEVTLFEDFFEALNKHNQNNTPLECNAMTVVDDKKQRQKMAEAFYTIVRKEIEEYQERAHYLISTDSQSPAVMNRWVLKIEALEQKKREYEVTLHQNLDNLNSEFATLRLFLQELQIRSRRVEQARAA